MKDFDPYYFVTSARALIDASPAKIGVTDETGNMTVNHPLHKKLEASASKFESNRSLQVRAVRYFSAETMVLLFLSGHPSWPYIRVASELRERQLARTIRSIANSVIPEGFGFLANGRSVEFDEWVNIMMFCGYLLRDDEGVERFESVFFDEVNLLLEKGALNAYKHGKPKSFGIGASLRFQNPEGEWVAVNQPVDGVNWIDWRSEKSGLTIGFGTEELSEENDLYSILMASLVMDAMVNSRRRKLGLDFDSEIQVPAMAKARSAVKRQNFSFRVDKRR